MPFKSEAQRKKFAALVKEGKLTQEVFDAWESETTDKKLPKKIGIRPQGLVRRPRRVIK